VQVNRTRVSHLPPPGHLRWAAHRRTQAQAQIALDALVVSGEISRSPQRTRDTPQTCRVPSHHLPEHSFLAVAAEVESIAAIRCPRRNPQQFNLQLASTEAWTHLDHHSRPMQLKPSQRIAYLPPRLQDWHHHMSWTFNKLRA
jgi:hypothetical protein